MLQYLTFLKLTSKADENRLLHTSESWNPDLYIFLGSNKKKKKLLSVVSSSSEPSFAKFLQALACQD